MSTRSDSDGRWVLTNALPGPTTVSVELPGFKRTQHEMNLVALQPGLVGTQLEVGGASEAVNVTSNALNSLTVDGVRKFEDQIRKNRAEQLSTPSANVTNLQRRVAGILPVQINVPKSGRSYRFVRALVLDEETRISFHYKSK